MFKEIKTTEVSNEKCGVGSVWTGDTRYLLIQTGPKHVGLMRLYDFV